MSLLVATRIDRGDKVRLTPTFAKTMMGYRKQVRYGNRQPFDWRTRRGEVAWINSRRDTIGVKWDGRKSIDALPPAALERIA